MTAGTVELPAAVASELVAVVAACLDNVAQHVGPRRAAPGCCSRGSRTGSRSRSVTKGPGIPEGRLEQAAADGRLGVSQSIRGRLADLGGRATLTTGPDGTEWELVAPLEPLPRAHRRDHPRQPPLRGP